MKSWLKNKIKELYPGVDPVRSLARAKGANPQDLGEATSNGMDFDVLVPPSPEMGDYSTNLPFVLARANRGSTEGDGKRGNPEKIGKEIVERLSGDQELREYFEKIESAGGGYVNFHLSNKFLQKKLKEISSDGKYGQSNEGKGKKVIVEYSSPNIAKPMHIGHLRSTIIGDALANVYENLGYEVVRWNFIGDWGTQFGKVIAQIKKDLKLSGKPLSQVYVSNLNSSVMAYVKFHKEAELNPELENEAREEFKKLEEGDDENKIIWSKDREVALEELKRIYSELGVRFQNMVFKGESDYEPQLKPLIEELKKKGLAKESEGTLIIELENLPPAMLRKSDGATLYITRDLASLKDRLESQEYGHPAKILYVVANQQVLHFEQLFQIAKKLGWDSAELIHVKFGMVLGEDGKKLATREGKIVPLQEVIDKLNTLALDTVKEKNPNLNNEEAKKIAKVVSIGALKYNDLKQHPYSDITFDWKAMLDLSGNSGSYIQYTYARLASILNKAGKHEDGDLALLTEQSSRTLMRQLLDFPEVIFECAKLNTLNGLALYLYEFAHRSNQFYEQIRILEDDNVDRRNARLLLVETTASVLKRGLDLLGIKTLERV